MGLPGRIIELRRVRERVDREHVRAAKAALSNSSIPPDKLFLLFSHLDGIVAPAPSDRDWPGGFSMISLAQIGRVWDWIAKLPASSRPSDVDAAFKLVLQHIVPGTGEVALTRDQFAEKLRWRPARVSVALNVLADHDVLIRSVTKVRGLRGPGVVSFSINPNVAWNGDLDVRKREASKRPLPLLKSLEPAS